MNIHNPTTFVAVADLEFVDGRIDPRKLEIGRTLVIENQICVAFIPGFVFVGIDGGFHFKIERPVSVFIEDADCIPSKVFGFDGEPTIVHFP